MYNICVEAFTGEWASHKLRPGLGRVHSLPRPRNAKEERGNGPLLPFHDFLLHIRQHMYINEWHARKGIIFYRKYQRQQRVKSISPCCAPCGGRGVLPTPRGEGPRRCGRARDRALLRGPRPAGAGAGWAGRAGGRRRWTSSPSRPSSSHCSVLSQQTMDNKHVFKAARFISWDWSNNNWRPIFLKIFCSLDNVQNVQTTVCCRILWAMLFLWGYWSLSSATPDHWSASTHNKHLVWQYPIPRVWHRSIISETSYCLIVLAMWYHTVIA